MMIMTDILMILTIVMIWQVVPTLTNLVVLMVMVMVGKILNDSHPNDPTEWNDTDWMVSEIIQMIVLV